MCGCSNFVNNDEKEFITQAESNREFDFTGNRPSIIEVGEDPSFDFTGNRPSVIEVGEDPSFDFMSDIESNSEFDYFLGKKAKARRQERRATRKELKNTTSAPVGGEGTSTQTQDDTNKTTYGQGDWFSRNLIWIVVGVAVVGGGYYIYKKRK